jgi:aspartyl protease family protein
VIALRRRLLWLLLAAVAAAMLALAARQDSAILARMADMELTSLAEKLAVIVLAGTLVLSLFRERLSHSLEMALIWVALSLLLVVGYTYRFELRDVADRAMAELMPGRSAGRGRAVEIARGRNGDFAVTTQVNGARIPMILDTGASAVVLSYEAARAAGLPLEMLDYSLRIDTANGRARAASVTLDRLAVGSLTERSVKALIAQPGQLKTSLLGMSFLNRLESWEGHGDALVMRGYP